MDSFVILLPFHPSTHRVLPPRLINVKLIFVLLTCSVSGSAKYANEIQVATDGKRFQCYVYPPLLDRRRGRTVKRWKRAFRAHTGINARAINLLPCIQLYYYECPLPYSVLHWLLCPGCQLLWDTCVGSSIKDRPNVCFGGERWMCTGRGSNKRAGWLAGFTVQQVGRQTDRQIDRSCSWIFRRKEELFDESERVHLSTGYKTSYTYLTSIADTLLNDSGRRMRHEQNFISICSEHTRNEPKPRFYNENGNPCRLA